MFRALLLVAILLWVPFVVAGSDPEFAPYIRSFVKAANRHNKFVSSKQVRVVFVDEFADLPPGIIGYCYDHVKPTVVFIDRTWWEKFSDEDQHTWLIWHELGHCILGREHDTHELYLDILASIMYPSVISPGKDEAYYLTHKKYYENELFR